MDVREKMIEQAISHFLYGVSHDIFSEPVTTYAKLAIEALEKEKEIGVTVQEWISVNDRLPVPFENVLVFRDGKISIDYNEGNGWFAYDFNGKRVTHWMPLPLAPTAS